MFAPAEQVNEKPCRVRDPQAIKAARREACELCGAWCPEGHVHHARSKGAGGDDVRWNLIFLCPLCHHGVHAGNISRQAVWDAIGRRARN